MHYTILCMFVLSIFILTGCQNKKSVATTLQYQTQVSDAVAADPEPKPTPTSVQCNVFIKKINQHLWFGGPKVSKTYSYKLLITCTRIIPCSINLKFLDKEGYEIGNESIDDVVIGENDTTKITGTKMLLDLPEVANADAQFIYHF